MNPGARIGYTVPGPFNIRFVLYKTLNKLQRIPKDLSQKDNPENLGSYGTQDKENQSEHTTG